MAAAQAKANEIYQQLKDGAKFDEIARKESNGSTAEQGGDLGYFKRNDLAKELEDQSFALKAGEFTQPIRTRQGFIILRVDDHIEAGTPPLDRIRDQIQDQIYSQKMQPALRDYLTKLREEAYIDIKPGYTDSGASPNQTKLIYTSDTGPQTKQVRGKLGMGKEEDHRGRRQGQERPPSHRQHLRTRLSPKPKSMPSRRPIERPQGRREPPPKAAAVPPKKRSSATCRPRSAPSTWLPNASQKEARLRRQERSSRRSRRERSRGQGRPGQAAKRGKKSEAAPANTTPQADAGDKDKTARFPPRPSRAQTRHDAPGGQAAKAAEWKLNHDPQAARPVPRPESATKAGQGRQADPPTPASRPTPALLLKKKKSISWF